MKDLFSLEGKIAVVTGANTGIGQGICVALAGAGANIAGVARRTCSETKALVEKAGGEFFEIRADLSRMESIPEIIDRTVGQFGKLDILVNNAGIIRRADSLAFSEEDWDDVITVNQKTVFFLCKAAAERFIGQNSGGKIINIASMLSFQGGIRVPSYTASKSAVKGMTMTMANEWAKLGINVNCIAPGYILSNNTADLIRDEKRSAEILARIPAGRWGKPSDIGGAAVFLASKASDYVNGFTLAVDGGWLGR